MEAVMEQRIAVLRCFYDDHIVRHLRVAKIVTRPNLQLVYSGNSRDTSEVAQTI